MRAAWWRRVRGGHLQPLILPDVVEEQVIVQEHLEHDHNLIQLCHRKITAYEDHHHHNYYTNRTNTQITHIQELDGNSLKVCTNKSVMGETYDCIWKVRRGLKFCSSLFADPPPDTAMVSETKLQWGPP